jgi:glutathione S-transferase
MPDYPVVYSFRRCPYAMRARLALYSSQLIYELREVILSNKPSEMLLISQKATVPVLQLESGLVIDESLEIMKWALEKSDPDGLLPVYYKYQNELDELILLIDTEFKVHLDKYKYPNRYEGVDPIDHRNRAMKILQQIEGFVNNRLYFYGENLSFADMAILPFIRQYRIADPDWFDIVMPLPAIKGWLNQFLQNTVFHRVMIKTSAWVPNQDVVLFPRSHID